MSKSPLVSMKERFESKEKLVSAVEKLATKDLWVERVNGTKGLGRVSNAKLLRLHAILSDAKERFGSRDKLIGAIAELAKRPKDKDYATSLGTYPLPRLLDLHRSLSRGAKRSGSETAAAPKAAKKAKPAKAEQPALEAKPAAKKTAAKAAAPEKKPAAKKAAKKS